MKVVKFNRDEDCYTWNEFLVDAKNKTFLFNRNFMDYHKERFVDFSLMVYDNRDRLVALLPANIDNENSTVYSHNGLSYGSVIYRQDEKLESVIATFHAILKYLSEAGIKYFILKTIPSFYNAFTTNEVEYALFIVDADLYRRDVALVVDRENRIQYSGNIRREASKANKMGTLIFEDPDPSKFWNEILSPNLESKFGKAPVHSLAEIKNLMQLFPDNIRLLTAYFDNEIVAGTLLFIEEKAIHCQYISANDRGRKTGALNSLFCELTDNFLSEKRYFDFGIVNENEGKDINSGLLFWKENFGGRAVKHDFYQIETSQYKSLEKFLK